MIDTRSSYILIVQAQGTKLLHDIFYGYKNTELKETYNEYTIYPSIEAIKKDKDAVSLTGLAGAKRFIIRLLGDQNSVIESMRTGNFSSKAMEAFNYDELLKKQQLNQEVRPVLFKTDNEPPAPPEPISRTFPTF